MSKISFSAKIKPSFIKLSLSIKDKGGLLMGKPKKRTSPRRTGTRRSHLVLKLARAVNAKSAVKVRTTNRETGIPKDIS
ncbi:MAG TPA: hypothetical protein VNE40_00220 [Candidatus Dormibacteraeota bacterium]|nr:hypothetical protein [Candidatus Dormibacteraeota bacterium]